MLLYLYRKITNNTVSNDMTPEHRIKRLEKLIAKFKEEGEYKTLVQVAEKAGVNPSYLSQLLGGHRKFLENAARSLEEKLSLVPLYFDLSDIDDIDEINRIEATVTMTLKELNKFRTLMLGESCQLNSDTIATCVVGGWIYTIERRQYVGKDLVVTDSSCFAPFTTQKDLDDMVDRLIEKL